MSSNDGRVVESTTGSDFTPPLKASIGINYVRLLSVHEREIELRWFIVGALAVLAILVTRSVLTGVQWTTVGAGIAYGIFLMTGIVPVFAASYFDAREKCDTDKVKTSHAELIGSLGSFRKY